MGQRPHLGAGRRGRSRRRASSMAVNLNWPVAASLRATELIYGTYESSRRRLRRPAFDIGKILPCSL
ncbi:MAG: hypothetical protein R2856_12725 [Caldilineaceae bacterium]